jgi:hypothetical protein
LTVGDPQSGSLNRERGLTNKVFDHCINIIPKLAIFWPHLQVKIFKGLIAAGYNKIVALTQHRAWFKVLRTPNWLYRKAFVVSSFW